MDLGPIEERANEFATWIGKFDSAHRIPAAFASAADVPALVEEVKRLRTVYAEVDCEALRRFVDSFCDDEAGEVEHVMSADGTSGFALTGGNDAHAVLRKAASALWPGESRAEAARPAPAWDEEVVAEAVATALHGDERLTAAPSVVPEAVTRGLAQSIADTLLARYDMTPKGDR